MSDKNDPAIWVSNLSEDILVVTHNPSGVHMNQYFIQTFVPVKYYPVCSCGLRTSWRHLYAYVGNLFSVYVFSVNLPGGCRCVLLIRFRVAVTHDSARNSPANEYTDTQETDGSKPSTNRFSSAYLSKMSSFFSARIIGAGKIYTFIQSFSCKINHNLGKIFMINSWPNMMFVLEISVRNSASLNNERTQTRNRHWTDFDTSYKVEDKEKTIAARLHIRVLFTTHLCTK